MSKNKSKLNRSNEQNDKTDFKVFLTVFGYCLLIILLPVVSYFSTKVFLESYFDLTNSTNSIYSAISSIIFLHLALGLYLYKAYSSDQKPQQKID